MYEGAWQAIDHKELDMTEELTGRNVTVLGLQNNFRW